MPLVSNLANFDLGRFSLSGLVGTLADEDEDYKSRNAYDVYSEKGYINWLVESIYLGVGNAEAQPECSYCKRTRWISEKSKDAFQES